MNKRILLLPLALLLGGALLAVLLLRPTQPEPPPRAPAQGELIALPTPRATSDTSVEEALQKRRSVREYGERPLTLAEVGQLLWAAQGISEPGRGFRTAPSAGALYPLELDLVAGNVVDLAAGVYRYHPAEHALARVVEGDVREALYRAALHQTMLRDAPVVLVFSAVYARTTAKYGERGIRYADMEAGHAAQNALLQAVALDLGGVVVGAFQDEDVQAILKLAEDETPLYLLPLGKP